MGSFDILGAEMPGCQDAWLASRTPRPDRAHLQDSDAFSFAMLVALGAISAPDAMEIGRREASRADIMPQSKEGEQ